MKNKHINDIKVESYNEKEWTTNQNLCDRNGVNFCHTKASLSIGRHILYPDVYLYVGLTSEISEELAEKIVEKDFCTSANFNDILYKNYHEVENVFNVFSAKESFLTLCDLEYCVIIKNN